MAGKKFKKAVESYDSSKRYTVEEACALIPKLKISSKWDETVDASVRLGVNPKYADQITAAAKSAFLQGDDWAYTAGAVAVLLGAVLVFFCFPRKEAEEQLLREYAEQDGQGAPES